MTSDTTLKRYWIKFKVSAEDKYRADILLLGCGVTAYNLEDALSLVQKGVFEGKVLPLVEYVIENIDVSLLETNHVLPNIGVPIWRGIWFPKGYEILGRG